MKKGEASIVRTLCRTWIIACFGYFGWEALAYRGLFKRLAEFQISQMGGYAPLLTYFFLAGLTAIPAWLLLKRARRRHLIAAGLDDGDAYRLEQLRALQAILRGFALVTSASAIAFGLYASLALPDLKGPIQSIAASEVSSVNIIEGPARLVGGEIGEVALFGQSWLIGGDRMAFAPYRVASNRPGAASLFVQLPVPDSRERPKFRQQTSWSGIIVKNGLPGTVRTLFGSVGIGIAEPHYTLYSSEYDLKIWYWLQSIQWALVTFFLLGCTWLLSRQAKGLEQSIGLGPTVA